MANFANTSFKMEIRLKKFFFQLKTTLFLSAFMLAFLPSRAQLIDPGTLRAEEVFTYLLNDESENLYNTFNKEMRQALTPDSVKGLMKQIQIQIGRYSGHDEWHRKGIFYTTACHFAATDLLLIVALDDSSRVSGLRFAPVTATSTAQIPDNVTEKKLTIKSDTFKLPAVICEPRGKGATAIVVLVAGSGPQDMDETVGPNKLLRDLAWMLAKKGIATLRFDKRTYVYGKASNVTTVDDEVTDDVLNIVSQLQSPKIFVLGHSLGGMMAPRIAQRASNKLAGIILMAAPARQLEVVAKDQIDKLVGDAKLKQEAMTLLEKSAPQSYWESLHTYDQVKTAQELNLPILVLQGERDYQVSMVDYNLWQKALQEKATFRSFPKLNHLFQTGDEPSTPAEYNKEGHVTQEVADAIADFVNR